MTLVEMEEKGYRRLTEQEAEPLVRAWVGGWRGCACGLLPTLCRLGGCGTSWEAAHLMGSS